MPEQIAFDYVVVRVVPRVDRDELLNVGVILFSPARAFLGCAIAFDRRRFAALVAGDQQAPDADAIARHLDGIAAVCRGEVSAGPIARLSPSERFHWLAAPRSTVVQTSPAHAGLCADPQRALEHLFQAAVPR